MGKRVQVLLSAYNGELYLREQLDSLLGQNYPNLSILVRDDGSGDNTASILEEYEKRHDGIEYYQGENVGAWRSFFDLMRKADQKADYFAFCDQDDCWLPDKVETGVGQLENMQGDKPLLYCSATIPVDAELRKIRITVKNNHIHPAFGNAVIENICTGCTAIINRRALSMAAAHTPRYAIMHDWWLYLLCSSFGEVYYDANSYIYYRQHGKNEVGARVSKTEETKYHLKTYEKRKGRNYRQLEEFGRLFPVKREDRELMELVLATRTNLGKRFEMIGNRKIFRQRRLFDLIYKGMVLLGDV